jgi:hypothetical protein
MPHLNQETKGASTCHNCNISLLRRTSTRDHEEGEIKGNEFLEHPATQGHLLYGQNTKML